MAVSVVPAMTAPEAQSLDCGDNCTKDESRFEQLVKALKHALGPSSGLTSDDVDVNHLMRLMEEYDANDEGWQAYNFGDASRGYTRNLVDEGNGKSNLVKLPFSPLLLTLLSPIQPVIDLTAQLVLVWSPGKGSQIHDHGNAHCLMKILRGDLTETRYAFPEKNADGSPQPMAVTSEKTYHENAVAYMADELGVHKMSNKGSDFAVSLHRMSLFNTSPPPSSPPLPSLSSSVANIYKVYTPPNVAKGGCNMFNEKTGKSFHVSKCGYYTAYGKMLKEF